MVSLPQKDSGASITGSQGCGSTCGAGLEKVYPTTVIRFGVMNWIGEFSYKPRTVFKCGAKVVIQTDRGIELGEQVSLTCNGCDKCVTREQIAAYVKKSGNEHFRLRAGKILREASGEDITDHAKLNARVKDECDDSALLAAQLGLEMKIVTVEHLLGGERVVYYFMSDGRVDFRELVHELADKHQTRIEMRQVGPRDEARLVADYEICGRECCCKNFLKTLRPITMKMAKIQKATLDLSKVSGRCGRLRCCLRYEHEGYESLAAKLPKRGQRIRTEFGVGLVVDRQILTQLVSIKNEDGKVITVPIEEITEFDVPETVEPTPKTPAPPLKSPSELQTETAPSEKRPRRRRRRSGRRDGSSGQSAESGGPQQPQHDSQAQSPGDAAQPPAKTAPENAPPVGDAKPDPPKRTTDSQAQPPKRGKRRRRRRRGPRRPGEDNPPSNPGS